ncbi:MAG: type II toxin-antitoxin system HigB family toxin [Bacteroidetes bacterium]|nr:type II toxin-antitoxin system HigB family toxin [Bacteroidota bacterium]
MVIITWSQIRDFIKNYPFAAEPLNRWYEIVVKADWSNLSDLKNTFNNVDYVGNDRYVFNIKGNEYRLVAMIHFNHRTVYIRFIGVHEEYDGIDCSKI